MDDSLLTKLVQTRSGAGTFCLKGLYNVMQMSVDDDVIARYMYDVPADNLAIPKFHNWFDNYIDENDQEVKQEIQKGNMF